MRKLLFRGATGTTAAVLCGLWFVQGCGSTPVPDAALRAEPASAVKESLKRHVRALAEDIGERNVYRPGTMERSAAYIERRFRDMGYEVVRQPVEVPASEEAALKEAVTVYNVEVVKPGVSRVARTLVIGAHYDTRVGMPSWSAHGPVQPGRVGTPGANDNASGVAALLVIAERLRDVPLENTVRFVAYANEEPPFYRTAAMGSRVHARALAKELPAERILGMISLETLGVYSPRVNKKRASAVVPAAVGLPERCDYVAFMSTATGRRFSADCARVFAQKSRMPVRQVSLPYINNSVSWSDDWSYMKSGIPSFAVTDTAFLRCDDYHETSDTWEKLDYAPFAEVVSGLIGTVTTIAGTAGVDSRAGF